MDEDLTASHWGDVLTTTENNFGSSNLGLIFDSLNLEDPHREPSQDEEANNARLDTQSEEPGSPFQASTTLNESELDELNAMRKQERDTHKSSLLMQLTEGAEDSIGGDSALPPVTLSVSQSLFEDKGSPIKIQPLGSSVSESNAKPTLAGSVVSPSKATQFKNGQFRAPRGRKVAAKTIVKHLGDGQCGDLDPLSLANTPQNTESEPSASLVDKTTKLFQAMDRPLYDLPKLKPKDEVPTTPATTSTQPEFMDNAVNSEPSSNDLEISLGDPVKVGDITTAHIVYGIKTQNKNPGSKSFPETSEPIIVSRRYKDFRWVYHQLQNNHPGKIIPPPPSKQTYIGRFNENFIENRRMSLEKMLNKISKTPSLVNDSDFVLFLTSSNFVNDAKERDQASGSGASLQASNGDDESDKSSTSIVSGTGAGGFMSSLFSMTVKHPEPDDFFSKKKGYIEDLEHNLKTFYKSLELIATQRIEITSVVEEIADIVEELAAIEILKTTTDLLSAFAEVHTKLKENLDRVNLQDQLTLGFTIEEYLRIIGSVKYTFETRSKIYQLYQSFKQDLMKKEESLNRLNSRYKSSVDKINQVSFEVDKLKQKVSHYEDSFQTISDTIKAELDNFEMEKIKDFRNSVEIFIESSIESQKEAIELWETFYERQHLTSV
ncbi:Vps5-domain-containing protein [Metschnikowia bicuspidata var. bicuspidata NRRL YB-4993]|uniref:Vps5-domain-containing protein n=1 Tax=Metschnikowia bicuspidata var. bicuspidata NRRL YB-4993 TaxID=869754 RepID=A0A1A0HJY0_9ASCO|nr:Vps5-domain-containing protein [Metschnikowia bicuspidata var. bicuspidata NRRL YB-4993]OBA24484.1 Vps5-domain-containing protein [Metschnikowia bicuspidata var. bicuspidata NRRL YB-4993]